MSKDLRGQTEPWCGGGLEMAGELGALGKQQRERERPGLVTKNLCTDFSSDDLLENQLHFQAIIYGNGVGFLTFKLASSSHKQCGCGLFFFYFNIN